MEFDCTKNCEACDLSEQAASPGLGTTTVSETGKSKAILFVGKAPGWDEDKKGEAWVGWSGNLLKKFIEAAKLVDYADVFLSNACRCIPPQGGDVVQKQIRACRKNLARDIEKLQAVYDEVILFALGAKACYSVAGLSSLNEGIKQQARRSPFFPVEDKPNSSPRIFFTNHPAMLSSGRKPALVFSVEAHFKLLLRYLEGEFIPFEFEVYPEVGVPVPRLAPGTRVTCDIETYGILAGQEQTVFNPIRSKEIDGVPYEEQTVTVSFGWYEGKRLRTALYVWKHPKHRKIIRDWFQTISNNRKTLAPLTGQNIKFDLLYLYMGDPVLRYWIDPRRLILDDTLLMSFLVHEQQPEKGLKEQATLLGIADYRKARVSGKCGTAKSPWDPNLHYYNCLDSGATIELFRENEKRILERYGPNSPKLSPVCAWMRNIVIWDTLDLELNGSTLDIKKLTKYHEEEEETCKTLMEGAARRFNLKLAGTGSDKPLRSFMADCVKAAGLQSDGRVEYSTKTKKISISVENVNLVTTYLPNGPKKDALTMFQSYKEHSKIITTYTGPLLLSQRKGIVTRDGNRGMVYPNWYPFPSEFAKGSSQDERAKGQIQGRFSCTKPARLTEPRSIRKCSTSRWDGGRIVEFDVNQDHIRMGALLSGDPLLMDNYLNPSGSVHSKTALTIFPDADPNDPGWKESDMYALGKTLNFLVLFRGGPGAFRAAALSDAGVEVDYEFCDYAIKKWFDKHHVFKEWQDRHIALAAQQGYLESPTGWGRNFGLGKNAAEGCIPEICNVLLQLPCAQVTQSAHYKIKLGFLAHRLRSLVCLQIYDAVFADVYPGEEDIVDEIIGEAMTCPPLLPVIEASVGRTIPWGWEKKEYKD